MIYSDEDIQGAVEATRQMILKVYRESGSNQLKLDELEALTPTQFYKRVLCYATIYRPAPYYVTEKVRP